MSIFLFSILEFFAISALMSARSVWKNGGLSYNNATKYIWCALSSMVWSIGFGLILVCENYKVCYWLRALGMVGTISFMITALVLIASWTEIGKRFKSISVKFAFMGVLVYPMSIKKELIIYKQSSIGTTYSFVDSVEMYIYSAYSVIVAILMYIMLVHMIKSTKMRRKRVMGKRLIVALSVVVIGMMFDTVFPIFGLPAIPASTMTQAVCVIILYKALEYDKKNRLDISNIADYIDNSEEVYILAYDETLKICLRSETASKFLGMEEGKVYRITDFFDIPAEQFRLEDESKKMEALCTKNDVPCNLGIQKICDEFGDLIGYGISITDITEKNKYINEIEKAKQQADMANESKSVFLAQMSHEIRTPLGAVLGMNEMIMREKDVNEIYSYAEKIQNAGKSLLSIIDDILDFSKIESGKMSLAYANYRIDQALQALYNIVIFRASKKGIELKFEIDEAIPSELYGDELRIRQILLNIVNNAIKYTKVGWVKVKVTSEVIDEENIKLKVDVEDTGIGIKKENLARLFDRFQRFDERVNQNVEGAGLGLSIVYNLVTMMNGTVSVKSVYQRGSIFSVVIPQKVVNTKAVGKFDIAYAYKEKEQEYTELFKAPDANVLVVDDNNINLTIVRGLLKRTEVKIDTVQGGFECLNMVKNKKYDIILLDHMMPDMDGIEVLNRLALMEDNMSKDAAVIALTANAVAGARERYLELGFDDYISKPIEPKELEMVVKKFIFKE